jgi:hypothetical protein
VEVIDLAALTEAVYQRPKSDSAGSALRTFLPAGALAIMLAEDLRVEGLTVLALPERPLLALRRGASPQLDRVVSGPVYTWYCYDDLSAGYGRLEKLPYLLWQAYESGLAVSTVAVGSIEVAAGAQTRDDRLHMLLQLVTVAIGAV